MESLRQYIDTKALHYENVCFRYGEYFVDIVNYVAYIRDKQWNLVETYAGIWGCEI